VTAQKRVLATVFVTVLLDLVGFGILLPAQPFLTESMGASPTLVTLAGATYSAMQFIFAPLWGRLSDRVGRRPVMLTSITFGIIGYVMLGYADSLTMLFAARAVAGFGNANLAVAQAVVADVLPPDERTKGMGLIGAAFGLGFIIGPAIGVGAIRYGLHGPAWTAAALGLCNLVMALAWLGESFPASARQAIRSSTVTAGRLDAALLPGVPRLLMTLFLYTTGFALMEQVVSLFIERHWAVTTATRFKVENAIQLSAYFMVTVGLSGALVQGVLIRKLTRPDREHVLALLGVGIVVLAFVAIPAITSLPFVSMLVAAGVIALGSGLANPSLLALLSRRAPEQMRGAVMGVGQSASALGRVVGPSVAGWLFERGHSLPFLCGALLIALCLPLVARAGSQRT
jgi:MFS family permease